jgi:hypothetical protein
VDAVQYQGSGSLKVDVIGLHRRHVIDVVVVAALEKLYELGATLVCAIGTFHWVEDEGISRCCTVRLGGGVCREPVVWEDRVGCVVSKGVLHERHIYACTHARTHSAIGVPLYHVSWFGPPDLDLCNTHTAISVRFCRCCTSSAGERTGHELAMENALCLGVQGLTKDGYMIWSICVNVEVCE